MSYFIYYNELTSNYHTESPIDIEINVFESSCESIKDSANSPLDQFLIKDFLSFYFNIGFNIKFLFTNMSFYLIIIASAAFILNVIYNKLNSLISNF